MGRSICPYKFIWFCSQLTIWGAGMSTPWVLLVCLSCPTVQLCLFLHWMSSPQRLCTLCHLRVTNASCFLWYWENSYSLLRTLHIVLFFPQTAAEAVYYSPNQRTVRDTVCHCLPNLTGAWGFKAKVNSSFLYSWWFRFSQTDGKCQGFSEFQKTIVGFSQQQET